MTDFRIRFNYTTLYINPFLIAAFYTFYEGKIIKLTKLIQIRVKKYKILLS